MLDSYYKVAIPYPLMTTKDDSPIAQHPFERPDRPIEVEARLESERQVADGKPACPVCETVVDLGALEHSVTAKVTHAPKEEPIDHRLSCSMPCFNEDCPAYLKLEVTVSSEVFDAWFRQPNRRFDYTYFRDGRPITVEAKADVSTTAPPPCHCPVCSVQLDPAVVFPLPTILVSGVPLPQTGGPPQHRVTAYASCPDCGAHLVCSCLVPQEELPLL